MTSTRHARRRTKPKTYGDFVTWEEVIDEEPPAEKRLIPPVDPDCVAWEEVIDEEPPAKKRRGGSSSDSAKTRANRAARSVGTPKCTRLPAQVERLGGDVNPAMLRFLAMMNVIDHCKQPHLVHSGTYGHAAKYLRSKRLIPPVDPAKVEYRRAMAAWHPGLVIPERWS